MYIRACSCFFKFRKKDTFLALAKSIFKPYDSTVEQSPRKHATMRPGTLVGQKERDESCNQKISHPNDVQKPAGTLALYPRSLTQYNS